MTIAIPSYQCCILQHNQYQTFYADQPKILHHPTTGEGIHSAKENYYQHSLFMSHSWEENRPGRVKTWTKLITIAQIVDEICKNVNTSSSPPLFLLRTVEREHPGGWGTYSTMSRQYVQNETCLFFYEQKRNV